MAEPTPHEKWRQASLAQADQATPPPAAVTTPDAPPLKQAVKATPAKHATAHRSANAKAAIANKARGK